MTESKTEKKYDSGEIDLRKVNINGPRQLELEEGTVAALEKNALSRESYRALKRDLIGMERENVGEIILQKCAGEGDWFEIAEHSALIYYYYVLAVQKKTKNTRFEDDTDSFYEQYRIGRIRVRGTGTVKVRIMEVGLYGGERVIHGRMVFTLKKTFTKERMWALEKKEAKRRLKNNKTLEVPHSDPLFYRNLMGLIKRMHSNCSNRLTKLSSQTNGARIVTLADGAMADYLHSTDLPEKDIAGRIEDWKEIRKKMYRLKYEIQIIDLARLWPVEMCLGAFETVVELKQLANKNLIKLLEEQKNERAKRTS